MQIEDQFATASQAAQVLGAKHVTVSQLCQSGRLPAVKIANRWLISRDVMEDLKELEGLVEANTVCGQSDIIARAVVPDQTALDSLVMDRIHSIPGVESTRTYIAIGGMHWSRDRETTTTEGREDTRESRENVSHFNRALCG